MTAVSYISYSQLHRDVLILARKLKKPDTIIGIPKSGMVPAAILAKYFDCRLVTLSEFCQRILSTTETNSLLLDDSIYRGTAMNEACIAIRTLNPDVQYKKAVIYLHPDSPKDLFDYSVREIPSRRYFEWNLMHHTDLEYTALDLDGVLCEDPTIDEQVNNEVYEEWLPQAKPLFIPHRTVDRIVTNRLIKYEKQTKKWLDANGVKYKQLIMSPYKNVKERRASGDYGKWKASHYSDSLCTLFIESSKEQAKVIGAESGKPVICLEDSKVYQ